MVKRFYMRITSQNPWKKPSPKPIVVEKQTKYNEEHGIVPQALNKKVGELLDIGQGANQKRKPINNVEKCRQNQPHFIMHRKMPKNINNKSKKLEQQMYKFAQDLNLKKPRQFAINYINCVNNLFLITKRNASKLAFCLFIFT